MLDTTLFIILMVTLISGACVMLYLPETAREAALAVAKRALHV